MVDAENVANTKIGCRDVMNAFQYLWKSQEWDFGHVWTKSLGFILYLRQQTSEIPQASSPRGALETYHEIEVKNKSYQREKISLRVS